MNQEAADPRLPRWALTRWLIEPGADVPPPVRAALVESLFGSIPIFIGGVVNTAIVSTVIAAAMPTPFFIAWAMMEILLAAIRLPVLVACRRAVKRNTPAPIDLYILLAVLWAVSVGFGSFISIWSGNWAAAALACLSAAAMVGGIAFRNFAAPRLVCVMIFVSFGPIAVAGLTSGEPLMLVTGIQIPLYLYAMTVAALKMNRMMVGTMQAEMANDHRARHDPLTGLLNRNGLAAAMDQRPASEKLGCFFIDLDGFKGVNDRLGHRAGDRLLVMVGKRLRAFVGDSAILARVGGDEFVIVAPCADAGDAQTFGDRLAGAVAGQPYIVDDQGVFIGASVGAALRAQMGLDDLISTADEALYQAKASGQTICVVAGAEPWDGIERRIAQPVPPAPLLKVAG